jgi:hypothetical protein
MMIKTKDIIYKGIGVVLFWAYFGYFNVCYAQTPAWTDEFTGTNSRWDWAYQAGTGFHRLIDRAELSLVEIRITQQSNSWSYSDCSLHETSHPYRSGTLEMRLKLSDDNGLTDDGKGTRGWGFWDGDVNPTTTDTVWFWSASPESAFIFTGLKAQMMINGQIILNQDISNVDMRDWHTYRIDIDAQDAETRFYIDGELVASTKRITDVYLRTEIWIDNYFINSNLTVGYLNLTRDETMLIDWVDYYNYPPNKIRIYGDVNGDNAVNLIDLETVLTNYKTSYYQGDINRDKQINALDFSIIVANW